MVDLFKYFYISWLQDSQVVRHQLFTLAQSIAQQQNGFLLCCGKLRENNFNKGSSGHKKYKNSNQACLDSIEWLID